MRHLLLATALLSACANKQSWDEISSTVYVHTLPNGAAVTVDGKPAGTTPVSVSIGRGEAVAGGGEAPAEIGAQLDGFGAAVTPLDRRNLPREIVLVLPPLLEGGALPAPPWNDARAMAATGVRLSSARRCQHAIPFFERALEIDDRNLVSLREGGRCHAKLGNKAMAAKLLGRYLMTDPEAADAQSIQAEVGALEGKNTIDLGKRP